MLHAVGEIGLLAVVLQPEMRSLLEADFGLVVPQGLRRGWRSVGAVAGIGRCCGLGQPIARVVAVVPDRRASGFGS